VEKKEALNRSRGGSKISPGVAHAVEIVGEDLKTLGKVGPAQV